MASRCSSEWKRYSEIPCCVLAPMLISAGMKVLKGFWAWISYKRGQKMGKSLGNVLDPDLLLTKYGNDPVRWYLIKDITLGNDGDFQDKRFVDIINNDLANTIGNLLNRTSSMSRKWFDNKVPNNKQVLSENKLENSAKLQLKTIFITLITTN